jgi:GT2 family glycosyltransferase
MDVSVVVPTFNRRELAVRVIGILSQQTLLPARYEVIVVVDGSTDGTAEALRALRTPYFLRVIDQENSGPACARNTGYRAAQSNLILFLDDDMLPSPGLIAEHIDAHIRQERAVAFGAIFLSADSPPSLATKCFNREIGAFYLERKRNPQLEWQMADCVFSNASLPRALLDEVGGFDEAFRKREDLELGVRLLHSGAQQRYIDDAIAYQYFEKTADDLIRDAEAFAVADVMFARKHPHTLIKGQLDWLAQESTWKRRFRRMAATTPAIMDLLLTPICGCGEICSRIPVLCDMGVRALQIRRRIHWYHKVLELGWQ